MHKGKTRSIPNIDTADNLQIDRTEIEKVTNYKYPGQTISVESKKFRKEQKQDGVCLGGGGGGAQRNLSGQAPFHQPEKKGL